MKYYLCCLFLIQIHLTYGQIISHKENDKKFNPSSYGTYKITLDIGNFVPVKIKGIKGIYIIDSRPDVLSLGYLKKGPLKATKKIEFETPGLMQLISFYERLFIPDTINPQFNIVLVVKELWFNEEAADNDSKDKILDVDNILRLHPTSNIKVRFDFYLQEKENYYPLFRLDTILAKNMPLKNCVSEFIQTALISSLKRVSSLNLDDINNQKTSVSWSSIQTYNNSRFHFPILIDTSRKRGVYTSYEEFKNNIPSITEFEINRGRLTDELFTKSENGKWLLNRLVWGYSDNNKSFIKAGDNYYELKRIENSFYLNGSKEISRFEIKFVFIYSMSLIMIRTGNKIYFNRLLPLKLNMATGGIY